MIQIWSIIFGGITLLWAIGWAIFRFRRLESVQLQTTKYLLELQSFQVRESQDRSEPSLNVSVDCRPLHLAIGKNGLSRLVLETRIQIQNNGRETVCVPAVYVSARALVNEEIADQSENKFYQSQFEALPSCGELTELKNVARFGDSIIQVAPGEIEHFVRWDLLGSNFAEQYPVLIFNIEAFGAAQDLLGFGRNLPSGLGPYRRDWLKFMAENHHRHEAKLFDRCEEGFIVEGKSFGSDHSAIFDANDRVLLDCENGKIDEINSAKFQSVLRTVVQWSRQQTIVLPKTS